MDVPYIPFHPTHTRIKSEILNEFQQFFDNENYILGEGLEEFEEAYAKYNGVRYAIGTGNGHDALLIALHCMGIGQGDEVLVPAHTFVATVLPIIHCGARPVLVDVEPDTMNVDPSKIEEKITGRTKAILPVHLYGNPCDMDILPMIGKKYGIQIIEDNAQAHGASYGGKKTGNFSQISFTSFYPTKNLGALGDAGILSTDSKELAEKARALRNYGRTESKEYLYTGVNSRMDVLQARMLLVKLRYLDSWNIERIELAGHYIHELKDIEEIAVQKTLPKGKNVRHIFPILVNQRDELKAYLRERGIATLIHYEKPIHWHECFFLHLKKDSNFPVAERICESELSLPIYPGLTFEQINLVCEEIKKFLVRN